MRVLLVLALGAGCASAPGPKQPDVSHRVPVNRTIPAEVEEAVKATQASGAQRQPGREGEVEWR